MLSFARAPQDVFEAECLIGVMHDWTLKCLIPSRRFEEKRLCRAVYILILKRNQSTLSKTIWTHQHPLRGNELRFDCPWCLLIF